MHSRLRTKRQWHFVSSLGAQVSNQILFSLREMAFPSKGWVPDHCLSKLSASRADVFAFTFTVSSMCGAHTGGTKTRQENGTRDKIYLHCPVPTKNTTGAGGKNKNNPAAPVHRTNREGRVFFTTQKLCTAKQVHREKHCGTTRTCERPSVHVRRHCTETIKNFPRAFARVSFELTSLDTSRHSVSQTAVQCATTTDVTLHMKIGASFHF